MRVRGMALAFCVMVGTAVSAWPGEGGAAPSDRRGTTTAKPTKSTSTGPAKSARGTPATRSASSRSGRTTASGNRLLHRASYGGGGLSCVPYARMVTGMQVSGNGGQWWHNAAGLYARGGRPEPGSVMAFRASGGMSRGHVAVVSQVLGPRHVQIDHANWSGPGLRRGTVTRNVNVIDVSERNDWSAVRVQVGHDAGSFGRTYPTYGFIYNRPDSPSYFAGVPTRTIQASTDAPTWREVAEAPINRASAAAPSRGRSATASRTRR